MLKRIIRLGLALTVLCAAVAAPFAAASPRAAHAQDVDAVRKIVQQWLLDTLDKPYLVLVEYTFAAASWDDSSLGCPMPGETYTDGVYSGYRWTFTFDNFVRYEVHSGLFGDPVALCSADNVAANVPLTLYSAPAFDVLVPEAWLVFPNNNKSDVSFGTGSGMACDQAGMRVSVLGAVDPGVTPSDLLSQYLSGKTQTSERQIPIGSFGRSATYETECDSTLRLARVTLFVENGVAYRVEQWAAEADFAGWDELFQNILSQFNTSFIALPTPTAALPPTSANTPAPTNTGVPLEGAPAAIPQASATPTEPQATSAAIPPDSDPDAPTVTPTPAETAIADAGPVDPDSLAALPVAHLFLGDVFLGVLNELPGRSMTVLPDQQRRYLNFSPDGRLLAYVNTTAAELRVINAAQQLSPHRLAADVRTDFPPAWSPDSEQIAYVLDTGERDGDAALLAIYRALSAQKSEPVLVGGFAYRDGCEVATHEPADATYYQEAGPGGEDNVLVWLPDGRMLVSTGCAGGLGVMDPDEQQIIALGDDLHGGVVAPDRTRFLARTDAGLAVLDFTAWERKNITLGTPAQQIAWGSDGQTVYYATATQTDTRTLDDGELKTRGEEFFGVWPVTIRVYALTLIQLDLRTDQPTIIWQGRGRGIGRIAPAPDGSGLLFTLVPSSLPLAEVFQSGGDAMAVHEAWPDPVLYWLGTGSASARVLAFAGQPAFGAMDLFAGAE